MQNELALAVFAGLAGMLGWGFADFFAKKTIDKIGDMATLTWAHVFGLLTLTILVVSRYLSGGEAVDTSVFQPREFGLLAFFGALQAAVYYFAYTAFGKGKLSLLNPVFSSYSGLVVPISVFAFGEIIGGWQLACLGLVFVGIISISLDSDSLKLRKLRFAKLAGMKEILAATVLAAVWTVLWGNFVSGKDWLVYAAVMYLFMSVSILLFSLAQRVNLRISDRTLWKFFGLIGLAEVIAYVGVSVGYSSTSHVSIVAVLSAAFSLPTLILAYIFLRERITKFQAAGAALVVAGVVLISLL